MKTGVVLLILAALTGCSRAKSSARWGANLGSSGKIQAPNSGMLPKGPTGALGGGDYSGEDEPGVGPTMAATGIARLVTVVWSRHRPAPVIVVRNTMEVHDAYHSIYRATCAAGETALSGYCQCHAGPTWINATSGNAQLCACLSEALVPVAVHVRCVQGL